MAMPNASIDVIVQKRIQSWLDGPYDAETKAKIKQMLKEDPQGLVDAFYTDLSFGTGGLRGIMGVGTNRMNRYTIQTATQGLANYLISQFTSSSNCGVVIGYDSRHHSRLFAEVAAQVLAGNGIHVYLLKDMRPTPYVSFAVRYKNCQAGIMITASHNPAEYNGYKVYWQDGAQVVHPHDLGITKAAEKIQEIAQIKSSTLKDPLIEIVDDKLDEAYLAAIRPLQHFPEINKKEGKNVSIAYTSLHGVGITLAPKALTDWGFSNIHYVKEQIEPNGDFPTVKSPNPENKEALTLGIHTMQQTESDIFDEDFLLERPLLAAIRSPESVVLLIDEVDRIEVETEALLLEILSDFQVSVPELGTIVATTRPSVFLTSNNTRELSEALKRRCVFLDLDYPTIEREQAIIEARIPGISSTLAANCAEVVSWIRSFELKKPPSVSETLDWARTLLVLGRQELTRDDIRVTLNLLLKYSGDTDKIGEALKAAR